MPDTLFSSPFEALCVQAERSGDREALVFPLAGERIGFATWRDRAGALARSLLAGYLEPGDHVALLAENRVEWPVVQMAVAAAGAVLVPLNTHYRTADLAYVLRQSRSKVVVLSPRFRTNAYLQMVEAVRGELPELRHVIVLDPAGEYPTIDELITAGRDATAALPGVAATAVGSLQYTSGTTGFPKGALLTHRGMLENAWQTGIRLGFTAADRYTSIIPLFHCAGCIMGVLTCLQYGATYVGVPAFDPETMFQVIEKERCTAMSGVPTSYLAMLQHPARGRYNLASLRTGTCGGSDANADVLESCAAEFPMPEIVQVYGQTESSTLISMADHRDRERVRDAGPPLGGYEVRVTDPETGTSVPHGKIGQIEARGVMTMVGYFENQEATSATLTPDGWLKTGDLGFLTPEGRVMIAGGRLRDMIIRGGENIYPVEIENVLQAHPAVAEVAVFGMRDDYYGEIVAAAVRLAQPVDAVALASFCQAQIARFKTPVRWFRVEAFPLTASGKIRKVELREMAAAGRLEALP